MPSAEVVSLYAGAVNYADASQLLFATGLLAQREGLVLPSQTLLGLSIELGFKAIYLNRVGDDRELRKPSVRHNLVALQELCLDARFHSKVAGIDRIVAVIGSNYAAHEYRYMRTGTVLQYVSGDGVIPAVQSFIDEVAGDVGLPLRPNASAPS